MQAKDLFEIGQAYEQRGKLDMAQRSYARIISLYPEEMAAYDRLSVLALNEGDLMQALAFADKGLAVNHNAVSLWNNRGQALTDLGDHTGARESFQLALRIEPENFEALCRLGKLYGIQSQFEEGESTYRKACQIRPEATESIVGLGELLAMQHRYNEAASVFDKALALAPNSTDFLNKKADSLYRAHRFSEAEAVLTHALAKSPNDATTHYNLALVRFSQGQLRSAWKEYEWRFHLPKWKARRSFTRKQQWLGEPLRGATLLVHAEQGFRDCLQFVRFISELAKLDAEIIVDIQPELYRLCSSSLDLPNVRWSRSDTLPGSDLHIPLLSLPDVLQVTYESMPAFKPYLTPRSRDIQEWRGKLNRMTGIAWGRELDRKKQKRIGIVWAGSPNNLDDGNRSMSFDAMAPLIEAHKEHAIFFSLQKDGHSNHPNVIDLGDELSDFTTTAAIVANLDLVISVDTSIVHLAGAMGKNVWTLLSHTPDWRWVIDSDHTKWYPSMSLIWQDHPGNWDTVIEEVIERL